MFRFYYGIARRDYWTCFVCVCFHRSGESIETPLKNVGSIWLYGVYVELDRYS